MSTPALRVSNLTKLYSDKVRALDDVSFEVPEGSFSALLGPNGAGKTTLIGILGGLIRPTNGTASVLGHDVVTDAMTVRRSLGIVPQEVIFDPFFTTRKYLQQQSSYYGLFNNNDWIDELIHVLGLEDVANTNTRKLSGGMKRRMMVGIALVHKPKLVVLDEPTAGVDVSQRRSLWEFIRRLNDDGTTIILTTHYLDEAEELCKHIVMLNHGKVLADDKTSILLANENFAARAIHIRLADNQVMPKDLPFKFHDQIDEPGNYTIQIDDYAQIEQIIAHLRNKQCEIKFLETASADLEDVFVGLTENKSS